jgi:hypothetical protein
MMWRVEYSVMRNAGQPPFKICFAARLQRLAVLAEALDRLLILDAVASVASCYSGEIGGHD